MAKLNEGMRPGDLEDLVLPMVSVDEYESKIDDRAIVIGFYVHDRDAADDLNRYIQKSPTQLLDTEVSPAPDQHGYYLVFVELLNDQRAAENVKAIVEEVGPLCGNEEWQMRVRGSDGVIPFSEEKLSERFRELRNDRTGQKKGNDDDQIMEFFVASDLSNVIVIENTVRLRGRAGEFRGEIVALDNQDNLFIHYDLNEAAMCLGLNDVAYALRLTRLLGENWHTYRMGNHTFLQKVGDDAVLMLKNADFC